VDRTSGLYAVVVASICCLFAVPLTLITIPLTFPPFFVCWFYGLVKKKPTEVLQRTFGFYFACYTAGILAIPALTLLFLWPWIVFILNFLLCIPYIVLGFRYCKVINSWKVLYPWLRVGGFSIEELFAAFVGSIWRQGLCEYLTQFTHKFYLSPIIKWVMITNPWLFKLEEMYFNQWTPKLDGSCCDKALVKGVTTIVTQALQSRRVRKIVDEQMFSVHYTFPPHFSKDSPEPTPPSIGVQTPTGTIGRNIVLLTHTINRFHIENAPAVRSTLSKWALYEVRLNFFNPYHHLTGLVEVNLTHEREIEHPLWCIAGSDSRLSTMLMNLSDYFFAYGLEVEPLIEHIASEHGDECNHGA